MITSAQKIFVSKALGVTRLQLLPSGVVAVEARSFVDPRDTYAIWLRTVLERQTLCKIALTMRAASATTP